VCSGIEAATSAWHGLGWEPVAFSEIEPFPSAVLKHHYPNVPNLGDMTKYKEWDIGTIDLLVGGTPCQSFSVAGLRKGLEDPRGNLALVYCGILDKFRPKWFIWENVPGVLSSNGGRDFGSFLGAVAELGYGFSYRVLDAQYFGVPQRRRRVFVVGCLGGWEHSAKVLFEPSCLLRDPPPRREKRQGVAQGSLGSIDVSGPLQARDYKDSGTDGFNRTSSKLIPTVYENHPNDSRVKEMGEVCSTVSARWGTGGGNVPFVTNRFTSFGGYIDDDTASTMKARDYKDATDLVAYSIREDASANNFSATEINVSNAIQALQPSVQSHHAQTFVVHGTQDPCVSDIAFAQGRNNGGENVIYQAMAFDTYNHTTSEVNQTIKSPVGGVSESVGTVLAPCLTTNDPSRSPQATEVTQQIQAVHSATNAVRRLTPIECERLQGFGDNFTNIPWRGKLESPDGLRYKALGNSMAVPVMKWIGERISSSQ
jgi:DNA (cytosine-5)-methyltransferase 1